MISPVLPGLAVTRFSVRQRPLSGAKPRSPRQRTDRSSMLRVRALILRGAPGFDVADAGCPVPSNMSYRQPG